MAKRRRAKKSNTNPKRPKGSYPLSSGDYVVTGPWIPVGKKGRAIRTRAVHRAEPDAKVVAQALLQIAASEALEKTPDMRQWKFMNSWSIDD